MCACGNYGTRPVKILGNRISHKVYEWADAPNGTDSIDRGTPPRQSKELNKRHGSPAIREQPRTSGPGRCGETSLASTITRYRAVLLCVAVGLASVSCAVAREYWYHGTHDLWTTPKVNRKPWHDELDKAYAAQHAAAEAGRSDPPDDTRKSKLDQEALDHFKTAIKLSVSANAFADAAKAEYETGIALKLCARNAEALDAFQQCITYRKKAGAEDTILVGDCYMQMGQIKEQNKQQDIAVSFARKAYDIYSQLLPPNDVKLEWPVHLLALYAATPEDAIPWLKQGVEIEKKAAPDEPESIANAIWSLALQLGNAGKLQEAIEQAELAIEWLKKQPGGYVQTSTIQDCIGHWRRQQMGVDPSTDITYSGKFAGRDSREKPASTNPPAEAPAEADRGKKIYYLGGERVNESKYRAIQLSNKACDQIAQRNYREAEELLNKALELAPDLVQVHANLGLVLSKLGRKDLAIEHLTKAVQLAPNRSSPLAMLASAYQANGQLDQSIEAYKLYLQRFGGESDTVVVKSLIKSLSKLRGEQKAIEKSCGSLVDHYLPYCTPRGKVRWSSTIKVYVAPVTRLHGYKPSFSSILKQCFEEWGTKTNRKVAFQLVDNKKDADIDCFFTNDFGQVDSPSEAGETQEYFDSAGHFKHCTIILLTVNATSYLTPSESDIRAVSLHEIGHSVGLMGHSPLPADIMFCTAPDDTEVRVPQLTQRDLNTLMKLYSD